MYLHFEMAPLKRTSCRLKLLKYTRVSVNYIWLKIRVVFTQKKPKTNRNSYSVCIYNTFSRDITSFREAFFVDGVILPFFTLSRLLFYHSIT